jgi:hypothetical protein
MEMAAMKKQESNSSRFVGVVMAKVGCNMFGWPSIGLAMAFGAFFGVYAGFGLALAIQAWCKHAQPEPKPYPGYDIQDEIDMIMESLET